MSEAGCRTCASLGKVDGKPVDLYTLTNAKDAVAKITNYGAIVTELHVPDRNVGRVVNRIKDATFVLESTP